MSLKHVNRLVSLISAALCVVVIATISPVVWSQQREDQQYDRQREQRSQDQPDTEQRQRLEERLEQERSFRGSDRRDRETHRDERGRQVRDDQSAGLGVVVTSGERGVRVQRVSPNSPAEEAGIEVGDEILAVNGMNIRSGQQLSQVVMQEQPGTQVDIRIERNSRERTLTATLESRREALNLDRRELRDPDRRFYRGSPPWNDDELMQHVETLERQVRFMQQEIEHLKAMLENDPSGRQFAERPSRRQGFSQESYRDGDRRSSELSEQRSREDRDRTQWEREQRSRDEFERNE